LVSLGADYKMNVWDVHEKDATIFYVSVKENKEIFDVIVSHSTGELLFMTNEYNLLFVSISPTRSK